MTRSPVAALLPLVLSACGGSSSTPDAAIPIDAPLAPLGVCDSIDPANPDRMCVGAPGGDGSPTVFTCAARPENYEAMTHGVTPPNVFLNSCAPRHLPLLVESSENADVICVALCKPGEAYQGNAASRRGVEPLTLSQNGVDETTEECRYWWFLEGSLPSDYSNTVGFAFSTTRYTWDDPNAPGAVNPVPSCADLPNADTNNDEVPEHLTWGCGPLAATAARPAPAVRLRPLFDAPQLARALREMNDDAAIGSPAPAVLPGPPACDPNTQAGCGNNEKCAWVRVQASPEAQLGAIACVPDGAVGEGASCTWGTAGEATGYDNCAEGLYCDAPSSMDTATGRCVDTCSLVDNSSNTCAPLSACSRYANVFANAGGDPPTGLCTPECDPITQDLRTD